MGTGIGLVVGRGVSTDGISFVAGVGFIGNALGLVARVAGLALGERLREAPCQVSYALTFHFNLAKVVLES